MSKKLRFLQNTLNNSGLQQSNNSLYQVISGILEIIEEEQDVNYGIVSQGFTFQGSDWIAWTPDNNADDIGTGTIINAYYKVIRGVCYFNLFVQFSGTPVITAAGGLAFTIPADITPITVNGFPNHYDNWGLTTGASNLRYINATVTGTQIILYVLKISGVDGNLIRQPYNDANIITDSTSTIRLFGRWMVAEDALINP